MKTTEQMNTYTDTQLKQALAKMLPEKLFMSNSYGGAIPSHLYQNNLPESGEPTKVLDTELLHLCWLVEESMPYSREWVDYTNILNNDAISATWQQRTIALAKVKGIEIV